MMLEILVGVELDEFIIENVVLLVFGKFVFVNWFYFEEVRVVVVLDGEIKFYLEEFLGIQKFYLGRIVLLFKVVYFGDKE